MNETTTSPETLAKTSLSPNEIERVEAILVAIAKKCGGLADPNGPGTLDQIFGEALSALAIVRDSSAEVEARLEKSRIQATSRAKLDAANRVERERRFRLLAEFLGVDRVGLVRIGSGAVLYHVTNLVDFASGGGTVDLVEATQAGGFGDRRRRGVQWSRLSVVG